MWMTGVTAATSTLSADLLVVGGVILGIVCLIFGYRQVRTFLADRKPKPTRWDEWGGWE